MQSLRRGRAVLEGPTRRIPDLSVVDLVRRQAVARPHAPAVHAATSYTYQELWRRVTAVAHALAETGTGRGDLVGVWCERTADTIVSSLAVMAAGAAYVPLEPTHPAARTRAIADAAGLDLVLTGRREGGGPDDAVATVIDVTAIPDPPRADTEPAGPAGPGPDDLAYVVFTSGTSGSPKGVAVEHRSVVNYALWCAGAVGRQDAGSPLISSLGFDLSMTSLWPQLATGNPIIVSGGVWDQEALFRRPAPFSYAKVTPSIIRFFEQTRRPVYRDFASLLILGGEPLEPELIRGIGDRLHGMRLMNHYGPTEATIGCCFHEFRADALPALPSIPIGRPLTNTRAYVVDESLVPVASGGIGELVIAGAGVARGYLAGDTDGRFIDEAELGGAPGRAYRTGDQVELLRDGTLLYLGRRDDQLKVSGYRIETAELRRIALAVEGVADAAFGKADGADELEAYAAPRPGAGAEELVTALRRAFAAALPGAACPRRIYLVPRIAVTANGKRDVAATARSAHRAGAPRTTAGRSGRT
jgi:D-alanine--poly(phosphoribitol) ligase subunit 1